MSLEKIISKIGNNIKIGSILNVIYLPYDVHITIEMTAVTFNSLDIDISIHEKKLHKRTEKIATYLHKV